MRTKSFDRRVVRSTRCYRERLITCIRNTISCLVWSRNLSEQSNMRRLPKDIPCPLKFHNIQLPLNNSTFKISTVKLHRNNSSRDKCKLGRAVYPRSMSLPFNVESKGSGAGVNRPSQPAFIWACVVSVNLSADCFARCLFSCE